jgi:hypothetical protein
MNAKAIWTALPLLIIALAAGVLWRGGGDGAPTAAPTLVCADLVAGCGIRLRGHQVDVGLDGPVKPLQPFQLRVKAEGARAVQARFSMEGMDMGFNLYTLRADADGVFRARVTLPVCVTGRRDWILLLEIDGAPLKVPFSSEI